MFLGGATSPNEQPSDMSISAYEKARVTLAHAVPSALCHASRMPAVAWYASIVLLPQAEQHHRQRLAVLLRFAHQRLDAKQAALH